MSDSIHFFGGSFGNDAYVETPNGWGLNFFGSDVAYIGLQIFVPSATMTTWVAAEPRSPDFLFVKNTTGGFLDEIDFFDNDFDGIAYDVWEGSYHGDMTAALPDGAWRKFEWTLEGTNGPGPLKSYVDGVLVATDAFGPGSNSQPPDRARIGSFRQTGAPVNGDVYIGEIRIGSTYGAFDIFHFEPATAPDLSAFTSVVGTVSLDTAPSAPPAFSGGGGNNLQDPAGNPVVDIAGYPVVNSSPDIKGVCIAFLANALDEDALWTRIDDPEGVHIVSSWSIQRGRNDELNKTGTGTATIDIIDKYGILDPTNSSSPIFEIGAGASIDPMRQIAIALKHPITEEWHTVFRGHIDEIELELDEAENVFRGQISCVDLLAYLARNEVTPDNGLSAGDPAGQVVPAPTVPVDSTGDVFYEDGEVNDRIRAGFKDADIPPTRVVVFTGNVNVQETVYAVRSQILQVVQDAADAEFPGVANLFVDRFGRIVFHGRKARFDPLGISQDAGAAWDWHHWYAGDKSAWIADSTFIPIKTLRFNRGMNYVINAALATPQNILDEDIAGQLSFDGGSITTYGVSSQSWENLITDSGKDDALDANEETKLFADYYADNYHSPRNRISQLVFINQIPGRPNESAFWDFACQVDVEDLIDVVTNHPGGGGFNESYFVEGVSYTVDRLGANDYHLVSLTVDLSPDSYYPGGSPLG